MVGDGRMGDGMARVALWLLQPLGVKFTGLLSQLGLVQINSLLGEDSQRSLECFLTGYLGGRYL